MGESERPNDEEGRARAGGEARRRAGQAPDEEHPVPLFLRDGNEGRKGDAQDEKDEVGE